MEGCVAAALKGGFPPSIKSLAQRGFFNPAGQTPDENKFEITFVLLLFTLCGVKVES